MIAFKYVIEVYESVNSAPVFPPSSDLQIFSHSLTAPLKIKNKIGQFEKKTQNLQCHLSEYKMKC